MNLYALLQASAGAGKPVRVTRSVARGEVLCRDDVADPTVLLRREMEAAFSV